MSTNEKQTEFPTKFWLRQTPAVVSGAPGIHRVVAQPVAETATAPASVERALASAGKPLDSTIQREMEQRFGLDLSRVRVHPARVRNNRRGMSMPVPTPLVTTWCLVRVSSTRGLVEGRRLLAHELTHVVQQSDARPTWFAAG